MTQEKTNEFVPFTKWKPYHTITFIDYEFTINGKNIEFDERVMPEQLGVKEGDRFVVNINEYGKIILVKE
jgi:hypothetical protein